MPKDDAVINELRDLIVKFADEIHGGFRTGDAEFASVVVNLRAIWKERSNERDVPKLLLTHLLNLLVEIWQASDFQKTPEDKEAYWAKAIEIFDIVQQG